MKTSREWSDAYASQGMLKIASKPPEIGMKQVLPHSQQMPCSHSDQDFQNCEAINFCCLSHLACYGGPRKLMHFVILIFW